MTTKDKSSKTIKILIAGIGGVGGFFGGLLAKKFHKSDAIDIYFLARGKHLEEIKKNGLKVKQGSNEFTTYPKLATDSATEIGTVDYIVLCTKTYDLKQICQQIKPCLHAETIILPLLNGVNNSEQIKNVYPDNLVLNGCVYIVSKIVEAGKIENTGNIQSLYFGLDNKKNERLDLLESTFKTVNIEATLSTTISTIIWEKYIFLSSIATATSYFDCTIGDILKDDEKSNVLNELVKEVTQIAYSNNVLIDKDILEKTSQKFKSLPTHITSSLHRDFQNKKTKTELDTLTGYVVKESLKINIESPQFNKMYIALKKMVSNTNN